MLIGPAGDHEQACQSQQQDGPTSCAFPLPHVIRQRFDQSATQPQPKGNDDGPEEKCDPPAPRFELGRAKCRGQAKPDQSRHHHGEIRGGEIERDVEPATVRRCGFHQVSDVRPDLATQREPLEQPEKDREEGRRHSDRGVGRSQRQARHRQPHHRERQDHRGLAAGSVRHPPDDETAKWSADEAHAEGCQGQKQRVRGVAGKKRSADLRREKGVGDEVVEFERVAGRDRADLASRQSHQVDRFPTPLLEPMRFRLPSVTN